MNKTEEFLRNKNNANTNTPKQKIIVTDKIKNKQLKNAKLKNTIMSWVIKFIFIMILSLMLSADAVGYAISAFILLKIGILIFEKIANYFYPIKKINFLGKRTLNYIYDLILILIVAISNGLFSEETFAVVCLAIFCNILIVLMDKTRIKKLKQIENMYNPEDEKLFTETEIRDFIKNPKDSDKEKQELYTVLEKISKDNVLVNSPVIKEKTSSIIKLSKEILEKGKNLTTNKKFFYYYLPELDKIQNQYIEMSQKGINSTTFLEFENKFESVITQIEKAFIKIHETMYDDEIQSANFDLNMLEKNLSRDGLIKDNDFAIDWDQLNSK